MSSRWLCLAFFAGLGVSICSLSPPYLAAQQDNERIATLIKQLGSDKYAERESATCELDAIGLPALPMLRAAGRLDNLEARHRALDLVRKLEDKLASEALLTPKMVKLNFKNISVMQAAEELRKQSGYTIFVEGDSAPLHERKISLETGEITFWEAFDKLCEVGKLVEAQNEANQLKRYYTSPAGGGWQVMPPPLPVKGGVQALPPPVIKGQVAPPQVNGQVAAAKGQALPVPMPAPPPPAFQLVPVNPQVIHTGFVPDEAGSAMIVVRDGTPQKIPTIYCGALRVRITCPFGGIGVFKAKPVEGEVIFNLEVTPEPRLQRFSIIGSPWILKALDDHGQLLIRKLYEGDYEPRLSNSAIGRNSGSGRQVWLHFLLGDKKAAILKEMVGAVLIDGLSAVPEAFITVDDVMNAVGQTVQGKHGGMIEVVSIAKQENGTFSAKIRYQTPPSHFAAKNEMGGKIPVGDRQSADLKLRMVRQALDRLQAGIGGQQNFNEGLPVLVDAKGKVLKLHDFEERSFREINGQFVQEVTLIFRPTEGVGPPAQMVLYGHRMVSASVPFRFENVPLP